MPEDAALLREEDLARDWRPQKVKRDLDIVRAAAAGVPLAHIARTHGISRTRVREIVERHQRVPERLTEAVPSE